MSDVNVQLIDQPIQAQILGTIGPKGDPGGNVESVGTFADLSPGTVDIPAGTDMVRTSGYAAVGDGGEALFVTVGSEPTYSTKFQSTDGRWWRPAKGQLIRDSIFGANGTDNARGALQEALDFASDQGVGKVVMDGDRQATPEITVHAGLHLEMWGKLTRMAQIITSTTAEVTLSGTTVIPVASTTGLEIGMAIMTVDGDGSVLADITPNDPYAHLLPTITAINPGTSVTVNPNGAVTTIPNGAVLATAGSLIILKDNTTLTFDIDGNEANQSYGYWISHREILVDGSNVRVNGTVRNTISEGILVVGPEGDLAYDFFADSLTFENIGGNLIHWGNHYRSNIGKVSAVGYNKRWNDTGISIIHQHQGAAFDLSNDCGDITIGMAYLEDGLATVGEIGSTRSVDPDILNDDVTIGVLICKNVYRPLDIRLGSRRINIGTMSARADIPYLTFAAGVSGSIIEVFGHASLSEDRPQQLTVGGMNLENVRVSIYQCNGLLFNDTVIQARDMDGLGTAGVQVVDSRNVTFDNVEVNGGAIGFTARASEDTMTGVRFANCRAYGQQSYGFFTELTGTATEIGVTIGQDCVAESDAVESNSTWVGMVLAPGATEWWNTINVAVGSAYRGKTRRAQNSQGTRIDGAFANDIPFVAYTSTFHEFVASANGAVTEPSADVYSCTVSGGTADTWRHVAHTTTWTDSESNVSTLRIVPKATGGTNRAQAGFTDALDASTADAFSGLDYAWLFFDGNAYVIETGINRTTAAAYAADDVFWVVRTASNDIEYWKGGDGVTHTTGTKVFDSISGVDETDDLRGKVSVRDGTIATEVKMYG